MWLSKLYHYFFPKKIFIAVKLPRPHDAGAKRRFLDYFGAGTYLQLIQKSRLSDDSADLIAIAEIEERDAVAFVLKFDGQVIK